jgi:hypothetical protein
MSLARSIRLLAAAVAVLALSSCSKSVLEAPSQAAQATKNPQFESAAGPDSAQPASGSPLKGSVVIDGAVGGKLSVGSFRVEVPAGAYRGSATITISQPDPAILVCDLSIDPPAANQFAVPVTLATKLPNALSLVTDQMLWLDPSVLAWRLIPSVPDPLSIELRSQLWHFSKYAAGRAGW